jgi:lysine 2,3-aminomutase
MIDKTVWDIIHHCENKINAQSENYKNKALLPESIDLLNVLLNENPELRSIMDDCFTYAEFNEKFGEHLDSYFEQNPLAHQYLTYKNKGKSAFDALSWQDIAAIRLSDYLSNNGQELKDQNLRGKIVINQPMYLLWLAVSKGTGDILPQFFIDFIFLFRQFTGKQQWHKPKKEEVESWMKRHPSGLEKRIIKLRKENKERIINIFINKMDEGLIVDKKFIFEENISREAKYEQMLEWWNNSLFHLRFAIRTPELLNEMLDFSLGKKTMKTLHQAQNADIPFFVNPYYLSLLNVNEPEFAKHSDIAIRDYMIYSKTLIEEYGNIVAWEKEDIVEPGKPNAAGWILPSYHNVHRRYPEVAILIPDTIGRACAGLCVSCQRMYDFQNGHLNFNLKKLIPKETWPKKLSRLMNYFKTDSQLRDILITGGDALMSSNNSLKLILDEVYEMAKAKIEENKNRPEGEKYAEMLRVRLGTRLPVYLPQRITHELIEILAEFKKKASQIGIKQFVIQNHFESPMEITPESKEGVKRLLSSGWIITNQLVFTAATSRRGYPSKLRKMLNELGILPYYTFSVKGFMENSHNFATNERAVQEMLEEKSIGTIPHQYFEAIKNFPLDGKKIVQKIKQLEEDANIPFLATDRSVLNMPGVGKSLTFRTIGLTHDGRRILEFEHDQTRNHSPIITKMGKVVIIESKSISNYLKQLKNMGEDIEQYSTIFGYSISETEERIPVYEYPEYKIPITKEISNFEME